MKKHLLPAPELQVYRDTQGQFRWRLRAVNRKTIADSAEGYKTRAGAKRAALNLKRTAPLAVLVPI